jgi:hypothetical protein
MRVVLAALLALATASAEAALPAPPFDLTLSSTSLIEGQAVTVRVAARPGGTGGERYDLYLQMASSEEAAFLTPEGTWAPRPVPYARSVSATDPPLVRQWPKAWPPGQHALGLVVVPASGDPLSRPEWRYRPAITWLQIAPLRSDDAGSGAALLWLLGITAAMAVALVWWSGAPVPSSVSWPSRSSRSRRRSGSRGPRSPDTSDDRRAFGA